MANELTTLLGQNGLAALTSGMPLHTLDVKSRAHQGMLYVGYQGEVPSLAEFVGSVLEVEHLLFHKIEIVDEESGELKPLVRCVVYCKDGKAISFCGRKAIKDVLFPFMLVGVPLPYKPPQRFKVTKTKTASDGRGYLNMEWQGV